jgi:hypothetical protein
MPQAAPIDPQAAAKERRSSSAAEASATNVLLTQACYPRPVSVIAARRAHRALKGRIVHRAITSANETGAGVFVDCVV